MNAISVATHIHKTVVARYLCDINRAIANVIRTNTLSHQANQSSQSVMFTAFTINIVIMNVSMGNHRQR